MYVLHTYETTNNYVQEVLDKWKQILNLIVTNQNIYEIMAPHQ